MTNEMYRIIILFVSGFVSVMVGLIAYFFKRYIQNQDNINGNVQKDISTIKEDVSEIKTDVAVLKVRIK